MPRLYRQAENKFQADREALQVWWREKPGQALSVFIILVLLLIFLAGQFRQDDISADNAGQEAQPYADRAKGAKREIKGMAWSRAAPELADPFTVEHEKRQQSKQVLPVEQPLSSESAKPASQPKAAVPAGYEPDSVQLRGIASEGSRRLALLQIGAKELILPEAGKAGGITVVEIRDDCVLIETDEGQQRLALHD